MNRLVELIKMGEKNKVVLSFSGGKDSTAMYLLCLKHNIPFTPVAADTGNEHPDTIEYIKNIHWVTGGPEVVSIKADFSDRLAKKRDYIANNWGKDGIPAEVVQRAIDALQPTGNPFLDLCLWKGRFPSSRAQFCTQELKGEPIKNQVIAPLLLAGYRVFSFQGIRKDESFNRSKQSTIVKVSDKLWIYRPIFHWTVEDVFKIHRDFGIEPNPLYKSGMGRVGCMPCINARKFEIRQIALRCPDEISRIEEWEHLVSMASKRGCSTFFYSKGDDKGVRVEDHGIRDKVEWSKTSHGGKTYDIMLANDEHEASVNMCKSEYGLCE